MGNQQISSELKDLIEIPEMEGYYTDGNGALYSTKRYASPRLLRQSDHYGNNTVQPYKRLKIGGKARLAHRVIASVHVGRQLRRGEHVNHIDGNAINNALSNLEVVTHQENVLHAVKNNLYCSGADWYAARGLRCPEGREISETRSWSPERTVKAHECTAP
jgi:hypothetical protein